MLELCERNELYMIVEEIRLTTEAREVSIHTENIVGVVDRFENVKLFLQINPLVTATDTRATISLWKISRETRSRTDEAISSKPNKADDRRYVSHRRLI
jgi:hypothetical protein